MSGYLKSGAILTGDNIKNELGKGIKIEPFKIENLHNNGYDLTLSPQLRIIKSDIIDLKSRVEYEEIIIPESGLVIKPNTLYLGETCEYTETYSYIPKISGRSSIAQCGLSVCLDSNSGDIGFKGVWVLEILNHSRIPIILYPYIKICRIEYYTIKGNI